MRRTIIAILALVTTTSAFAQLGDILRRVDPNKVKKGVNVAREATREFTEEEEINIGRIVAARVLSNYPLAKNEKLQKYVTLVGYTVAGYSARPTLPWHFAVVDGPIVNAFAIPGGFVFITTGALAEIRSEAELASVLGHEIAHVTQKHVLKEIKRANLLTASVDFAQATSSGAWLNDEMGKKIGDIAYQKLFTTGLSRRDEEEADRIGVQLAFAAGYRSSEMLTFLERLQPLEGSSSLAVLTSTHPKAKDRMSSLKVVRGVSEGEVLAERYAQWTR